MKKLTMLLGGASMAIAMPAVAADIVIGVPNWASVNATAHILEVVIEDNLGLESERRRCGQCVAHGAQHVIGFCGRGHC